MAVKQTRRQLLGLVVTASTVSIAGCTDSSSGGTSTTTGAQQSAQKTSTAAESKTVTETRTTEPGETQTETTNNNSGEGLEGEIGQCPEVPPEFTVPISASATEAYNVDKGAVTIAYEAIADRSGYAEGIGTFQVAYGTHASDLDLSGYVFGTYVTPYGTYHDGDGPLPLSLTPRLDPDDGIPDGYMVPWMTGSVEDPTLVVWAFVDEDFRNAAPARIMKQNSVGICNMSWTEIAPGVYADTIIERDTRSLLPGVNYSSNIYVGTLVDPKQGSLISDQDIGMELVWS